jgi:hypothetical protein
MKDLPPESASESVPSGLPPCRLVDLAAELKIDVARVERALGPEKVFKYAAFRCTSAFAAAELIEAHERRREERRRRRAAGVARVRATAAKHRPRPGVRLELPDGELPVRAMTAAADKTFEGGTYREVPGPMDWAFGNAEGGASIGPTQGQMLKSAMQRRDQRKKDKESRAKKEGGAK